MSQLLRLAVHQQRCAFLLADVLLVDFERYMHGLRPFFVAQVWSEEDRWFGVCLRRKIGHDHSCIFS